jgi:DinB superfamily
VLESERLVDQYDRNLNGDAWHGDNVWKILGSVRPDQAFQRVLLAAHTIWELVAHMTFWETEVCRRLRSQPGQSEEELNFPPMPGATAENWKRVLEEFRRSNEKFRAELLKLQETQLDEPLSSPDKSVYVEVNGVIQHHLYHAGQIAIIRKNLLGNTVTTGL